MINLPTTLTEKLPAFLANDFAGYFNKTDKTVLPFNVLTYPSINCTIPSTDKIVPDLGKLLYAQPYTENSGMTGNKEKFKNLGGNEMEIRVWRSIAEPLKRDVIEVEYQSNLVIFSGLTGTFLLNEPVNAINGTDINGTGRVSIIGSDYLVIDNIHGNFEVGNTIKGLESNASATLTTESTNQFHQITENLNPLPLGEHEYYFDEFWDSNLDSSLSKNLSRCVWVNGYRNPSTKKGEIYSWTGGIVPIITVTASSLTIAGGLSWRSYGFTEDANGDAFIVVNGVSYQLNDPTDLDSDTIDVTSTAGISRGDIATSQIEVDEAPVPFDMCRQNKGYMFYGNWKYRDLYMSNAFNRPDKITITSFAGTQNDLVLRDTSHYTGTKESVFHVTIDSVAPNTTTFEGNGTGAGFYNTTGYSASGTHTYKFVFVADMTLAFTTAADYDEGTYIIGATPNDVAVVVWGFPGGAAVRYVSGTFNEGDAVTGTVAGTSGVASTIDTGGAIWENWWFFYKDGALAFQAAGVPTNLIGPTNIALGDGLSIQFDSVSGIVIYDSYTLDIGQADTFSWQKDDGAQTSNVAITGNYQTLSDGVRIKFVNKRGHSIGDTWDITATPEVLRAWANFYYAVPIRKPGEGYIYHLTSNYWTMDTQEEQMYVNTSYGRWIVIDTILSADLQSESVSATPLKQAGSNKVLYPYLTGHLEDMLVYVTIDKNLDYIGRQELLEKPQIENLSDPVKNDFLSNSFVGGRIKYLGKRLYITSPDDGIMLCYDKQMKYWQPPKMFPEMGLLTIIGNNLVAHSNSRNQTFTLFASQSDNNGSYTVRVRTPYSNVGSRWKSKSSSMSFTEGYIDGAPVIIHKAYLDVNGCTNIYTHQLEPTPCKRPSHAPIGEGEQGSHPNGSDTSVHDSYFQEIYPDYKQPFSYHFISLELECIGKNHTYEYLSFGLNAIYDPSNNNDITTRKSVFPSSPLT